MARHPEVPKVMCLMQPYVLTPLVAGRSMESLPRVANMVFEDHSFSSGWYAECPEKEKPTDSHIRGLQKNPATPYFPTASRLQYHRPWRA